MTKAPKLSVKKLPVNLVMADLYSFNCARVDKVKAKKEKYFELREIQQEDGSFIEKLVEVDYPITADYVKSFEASADYKLDPAGAVANATPRKNLGDVTALQELYAMDTNDLNALADRLATAAKAIETAKAAKADTKLNEEVTNNGN